MNTLSSTLFVAASVAVLVISFSLRSECGLLSRRIVSENSPATKEEVRVGDHFPGRVRVRVNPLESILARAQDLSPVKIENDKGMIKVQFRRVLPKVMGYMGEAVHRFQNNLSDLLSKTVYG